MKKSVLLAVLLFAMTGLVVVQADSTNFVQTGRATWEIAEGGLRAAHPTLPIGSTPTVRNVVTGREATVTVTERISASAGRVIDVSADVARAIGLEPGGYVTVLFSASTEGSAPPIPRRANIVIYTNVAEIPGVNVTISEHVTPDQVQRVDLTRRPTPVAAVPTAAVPRAALVVEEIERPDTQDVFVYEVDDVIMPSLENIYFNPGTAYMLPYERDKIYRIVEVLKRYPDRNVLIAGHTNLEIGETPDFLMWVSMERARRIASNLMAFNIPANRLTMRGYGAERLIADHTMEETARRNRRVEITILDS